MNPRRPGFSSFTGAAQRRGNEMLRSKISVLAAVGTFLFGIKAAGSEDNLVIWKEFVAAVKDGKVTADMVRPYAELPKEVLLKQLVDFKGYHDKFHSWKEWENPEVFPVGDLTHYIVTFTWGGQTKSAFCFTLLKE